MKLELKNVTCGYGLKSIVQDVSMEVNSGEVLCMLGPNGVGKTILFKTILVPNHVFLCATKVAVINNGRLVKMGKPDEVITKKA